MNCSSFRNSSTKLSEGHNWPGRSLHRSWRICWGLSSAKDQTLEFRTCKYVKTVWRLEVRNFIPREGLHSVNFVDRWPLGRAMATFHGRVMHHCYEWRSSQFPCKMQDIARSLAWSVCVIETDRRWRCLADWNGWTFSQSNCTWRTVAQRGSSFNPRLVPLPQEHVIYPPPAENSK